MDMILYRILTAAASNVQSSDMTQRKLLPDVIMTGTNIENKPHFPYQSHSATFNEVHKFEGSVDFDPLTYFYTIWKEHQKLSPNQQQQLTLNKNKKPSREYPIQHGH